MGELLTCSDFGRGLDPPLTPAAVRAAERSGRITAAVKTPSGQRLFTREEQARFQAERAEKAGLVPTGGVTA